MKDVVAGVDIGGTNTVIGIVDDSGNILEQSSIRTNEYPLIENFVDGLSRKINKLAGDKYSIKRIGIGAPNGNYNKGTIELAPNLQWKGIVPLADMVKEKTGLGVALTNDANAAALGEMMFGGARGMKNFVMLTLGTGLGSGLVVNGKVVYGHSGFAGECGHITMIADGRDCGCGRQGCLETYVSATGIVRTVQWLLSEMNDQSLLRDYHHEELTSKIIANAANQNDLVALQAFDYTAEILARAIVNIVVVTSPEAVFLFGGLTNSGNLLLNPLNDYVSEFLMPVFKDTFTIKTSEMLENNAAVLGSAALAWKEL